MDARSWEILLRIMSRMADGDNAAIFDLYSDFGAPIAATIRRLAGPMGASLGADEVDDLVLEACMALMDAAPSWDPNGGALPWNWAERRLRHIVALHIGVHADSLDERLERGGDLTDIDTPRQPIDDDDPLETLVAMSEFNAGAQGFLEALSSVASPRDRRIFLEVIVQVTMGDRAPAVTVGRLMGMKPASVRQVVKRTRDRLARLGVAVAA